MSAIGKKLGANVASLPFLEGSASTPNLTSERVKKFPGFYGTVCWSSKVYSVNFATAIPMSTSVKLSESDKRKLERLQAMVTVRTSRKVTQQEILSKLISNATEEEDDFIKKTFESTVPISDSEYQKILSLIADWGVKTKWEDIDETLYGFAPAGNTKQAKRTR